MKNYKPIKLKTGLVACWLVLLLTACGGESGPTVTPTMVKEQVPLSTAIPVPANATPVRTTPTPAVAPLPPATPKLETVPTAGPAVAGVLSAPPESRKLDFNRATLQRIQQKLGGKFLKIDLKTLEVAGYANTQQPADVFTFYRVNLQAQGWQETHEYDNRFGIYFTKGGQIAAVSATSIPDDLTVNFLAGFVPAVKGQINGGETLILLGQGPSATFEVLKANQISGAVSPSNK